MSLHFKSENRFAQGQLRRPRRHPANESLRGVLARTTLPPLATQSLSIPIDVQAFHYFAQNFPAWPSDMPGIEYDYFTYALVHWDRAELGLSLHLAVSVFLRVVFWRERRVNKALEDAEGFYVRSIIKTQKEIKELSNETIDQLIVAVLLVTSPECLEPTKFDFLYNASVHSYTTHGHAAVWMRYRVVRLIMCSIRMRLLAIPTRR
jgi:hypothetical protein